MANIAAFWFASVLLAFGIGIIGMVGMTIDRFEDFFFTVVRVAWGYVLTNIALAFVVAAVVFALSVAS